MFGGVVMVKMVVNRKDPMPLKAEKVKELLRLKLGRHFPSRELLACLSRINHFLRGERETLPELEQQVKKVLDENNVNPRTAYRWINTSILPEEYQEQMNRNRLSGERATKLYQSRDVRRKANLWIEILELGRSI